MKDWRLLLHAIQHRPVAVHATGAAVVLLLTGAFYLTTLAPHDARQAAMQRLTDQLADQRRRAEQIDRSRRALEQQLRNAQADLVATPIAFDTPREINQQLARIAELAGWSGLTVEAVDPGKPTTGPMLATQPIRIAGRGGFGACHTFMRVLREESPETSVKTFSLAADSNPSELRFEMELLWYSRPDGASAAAR
jgi:Tfp pilus assembly protein PilO